MVHIEIQMFVSNQSYLVTTFHAFSLVFHQSLKELISPHKFHSRTTNWFNRKIWANFECWQCNLTGKSSWLTFYIQLSYRSVVFNVIRILDIGRCSLKVLDSMIVLGYTHSMEKNMKGALVGSIANVRCVDETKRLEYDRYDNGPMDDQMSFVCKPTRGFNLPLYESQKQSDGFIQQTYPRCLGWCPKEKPQPPPISGLYLSDKDRNLRYKYT